MINKTKDELIKILGPKLFNPIKSNGDLEESSLIYYPTEASKNNELSHYVFDFENGKLFQIHVSKKGFLF